MKIDLRKHAEYCQMEADNMAYVILRAKMLASVQSVCDFNLFWLDGISDLVVSVETLEFIEENISRFKRRLTMKEFLNADLVISRFNPENFDDFSRMYSAYSKQPDMFCNLKRKSEKIIL